MFQDFKNTFEKSKKQCTSYMMVDGLGFKRALMEEVDIMKNEKVVEAERAFQEACMKGAKKRDQLEKASKGGVVEEDAEYGALQVTIKDAQDHFTTVFIDECQKQIMKDWQSILDQDEENKRKAEEKTKGKIQDEKDAIINLKKLIQEHKNAVLNYEKRTKTRADLYKKKDGLESILDSMKTVVDLADGESPEKVRSDKKEIEEKVEKKIQEQIKQRKNKIVLDSKLKEFQELGATPEDNVIKEKKVQRLKNECVKRKEYEDLLKNERNKMMEALEEGEED